MQSLPKARVGNKALALIMQTGQTTCRCGQLGMFKRRRKEFTVVGLMKMDALGHRGQLFAVVHIQTIFGLHAWTVRGGVVAFQCPSHPKHS